MKNQDQITVMVKCFGFEKVSNLLATMAKLIYFKFIELKNMVHISGISGNIFGVPGKYWMSYLFLSFITMNASLHFLFDHVLNVIL